MAGETTQGSDKDGPLEVVCPACGDDLCHVSSNEERFIVRCDTCFRYLEVFFKPLDQGAWPPP